jgi:cytidine deaminase
MYFVHKMLERGILVITDAQRRELLNEAEAASANAYAKYSNYFVGAAVLTAKGKIFRGCNVENVSYGLTNCAERTAIFSAIAAEGSETKIAAIAVVNRDGRSCSPCGACRQVIVQFGYDALVLFRISSSVFEQPANALLPHSFKIE